DPLVVAVGAARVSKTAVPRPAAHYFVRPRPGRRGRRKDRCVLLRGPLRIGDISVEVLAVPVAAPLPGVSGHVVQSPGVGLELRDRGREHVSIGPIEPGPGWILLSGRLVR